MYIYIYLLSMCAHTHVNYTYLLHFTPHSGQSEEDSREKYRAHLESYEKKHLGGYRRIYPNGNEEHYAKFFDQSTSLCAETAASRARIDLAKQQREEIAAKQKISEQYRKKLAPASEEQGKGKSDSVRPESPTTCQTEKKEPLKINRRGMTFRVPQYGAQSQREQQKERNLKSGEVRVCACASVCMSECVHACMYVYMYGVILFSTHYSPRYQVLRVLLHNRSTTLRNLNV